MISGFVFWFGCSLLSFFFFNFFFIFIFLIIKNFFILITLFFLLYSFFLFFSPFSSELCGWQSLGAPATCQDWASEVGELSSGHSSNKDLQAPCNIKQQSSPRDFHLNAKTQLHLTTSKLQCWTPYAKQLARQEQNPTH